MDDVISGLTPEQVLRIVERLTRKGGKIREAVVTEAMNILTEVDVAGVAEDVFDGLDPIACAEAPRLRDHCSRMGRCSLGDFVEALSIPHGARRSIILIDLGRPYCPLRGLGTYFLASNQRRTGRQR